MRRLGKGKPKNNESREPPNFYKISAKYPLQKRNQTALKSLSILDSNDTGGITPNSRVCKGTTSSLLSVMGSQHTSSTSILDSVPILHRPYRSTEFESKTTPSDTNDIRNRMKPNDLLSAAAVNSMDFTTQMLAAKQAKERNTILSITQSQDFGALDAVTASRSQALEMQQRIIEERLRQKMAQRSASSTSMIPMLLSQQQCNMPLEQSLMQPSVQNNVRTLHLRDALMKSQIENQLLRANLLSTMTNVNNNDDQCIPLLNTTSIKRSLPTQNTPYMNSSSNFFFS